MPSYNNYELAVVGNLPSGGSLRCILCIESNLVGLSIPESINILSISPVRESVDINVGVVDIANMTVNIADDYTDYQDGFWYTLLELLSDHSVQMLFVLTEGSTQTYFYRGSIFSENVQWNEVYITSTSVLRTFSAQLVSPILAMKNISTASLFEHIVTSYPDRYLTNGVNECITSIPDTSSQSDLAKFITVRLLLQALIDITFDTDSSGAAITSLGDELMIYNANASQWESMLDGWIWVQNYVITEESGAAWDNIFHPIVSDPIYPTNSFYEILEHYSNCFDLFSAICSSMCVVPKYYFGDASGNYAGDSTDIHSIELLTRGRLSTISPIGGILESSFVSASALNGINVITRGAIIHSSDQWNGIRNLITSNTPPDGTKFDMDREQIFDFLYYKYTGDSYTTSDNVYTTTNHFSIHTGVKYYDYAIAVPAYVEAVSSGNMFNKYIESVTKYLSGRFQNRRKECLRRYGSIQFFSGSTITHKHLRILQGCDLLRSVESGGSSLRYYAREVEKDVMTNNAIVKWVLE